MVRFAHLCDGCGERSPEYTPWLMCTECGNDVCPDCASHVREPDGDRGTGVCPACAIAGAETMHWDRKIHARLEGD
jgi:hypothetical protein